MLAALLYGQEDLRLEEIASPIPAIGEVVLKVKTATTCGTDLKVWRRGGHARMLQPPTLFGHEGVGEIVALGEEVTGWSIGDRVVANNSAPCQNCFFCNRRDYSLCPNLTFNNGTFAEYLKIPAAIVQQNLLAVPANLPNAIASLTEPLACVLQGIACSNVQQGDRVVVLGDGAIGLMFVAVLAHQCAAEVFLFGGNAQRLQIGEELGASQTFNHHQLTDVPSVVRNLTDGWGADIVIEATGVPAAWESAIACGRPGATINLFGGCPRDTTITVSTEQLHYNALTLKGVFHNTPAYVRKALSLLATRSIPFERLINDHRPLKDLEQAFQDMKHRKAIKVAIEPGT